MYCQRVDWYSFGGSVSGTVLSRGDVSIWRGTRRRRSRRLCAGCGRRITALSSAVSPTDRRECPQHHRTHRIRPSRSWHTSPVPAIAVAGSFLVMAASDPGPPRSPAARPDPHRCPAGCDSALRGVGLLAWLWIVAQAVAGGSSDADVASLFLWVYGWVGLALVSAFLGPVWSWLDPFTTIYDIVAAAGRRLGLSGLAPQPWPARLGLWIAWEAWPSSSGWSSWHGSSRVGRWRWCSLGYTAITLLGMAQYGRDPWRQRAETFSVWFGVLGRLAPFALVRRAGGRAGASGGHSHRASSPVRWPRRDSRDGRPGHGRASSTTGCRRRTSFFDLFGFPSIARRDAAPGRVPGWPGPARCCWWRARWVWRPWERDCCRWRWAISSPTTCRSC